eukprot:CAMPEP_0196584842 /NCGR_PEP_ID=MMETSP1081-20130531/48666_1 /TAXON_ID=36882 /ORGANISM="Pyramimonas amylifera, Strain CCMP720" /LENGTH=471 /DNA_ID=CAMNT_0041906195 /DNA_START=103 /DNA_END=1515 /DNA_ORIENTATION=-
MYHQNTVVDTGIVAFHTQGTTIAQRDTASSLASMQLPSTPMTVLQSRDHRTNWRDRSIDRRLHGLSEMHVLLHADLKILSKHKSGHHPADVLAPKQLELLCWMQERVTQDKEYAQVCRRLPGGVERPADDEEQEKEDEENEDGPCAPLFSILDLYGAYKMVGLDGVLDALTGAVKTLSAPVAADLLNQTCGGEDSTATLCSLGKLCKPDACPESCTMGPRSHALDLCQWVLAVQPTGEELALVAAMPRQSAHQPKDGCGKVDSQAVMQAVRAGLVFEAWVQRSLGMRSLQALAAPFQLLVDRWTHLQSPTAPSFSSNVTRFITRLKDDTPTNRAPAEFVKRMGKTLARMGQDGVQVSWRQWDVFSEKEGGQLLIDSRWAVGSFVCVFCIIWLATGSLLVAAGGMVGVLLAFPFAMFLYRDVLGFAWAGLLNLVALFLILGIAADDIFVVWEHWKQSPQGLKEKEEESGRYG